MPRSRKRRLRKARSRQQSMKGTAAEAAEGSGSSSQVPPSSPQHRGSTDTDVENHCLICLGSCREPSVAMPCMHCFCYVCMQQEADNKTQCPLCKGRMTPILHSEGADDDFEVHDIIPPMTPPDVPPARRVHREPDAPNIYCPEAHQQWETAEDVQRLVGGFELPNWMSCFSANSALQGTLYSWFYQSLEMLFETATPSAQHTHVPEQQRHKEDGHLPRQQDTRGATGQEDSSSSPSPGPARSSVDEMPGTSSSATGGGPSTHPSAFATIHVKQEPQEEPEGLCPGPPNSIRGSGSSPGRPRRSRKRRASSFDSCPACRGARN